MNEYKKNEIDDFKRSTNSKQKNRIKKNPLFLTDTQTSDYTKSSGQMQMLKIQYMQQNIKELQKENEELRKTILNLKANEFFQLNEGKLKQFIKETQRLRNELQICKGQLEQSLLERDFLLRFNKNLKSECQSLTKQLHCLKSVSTETKKWNKVNMNNGSTDELSKQHCRSASTEVLLRRKRERKKEENGTSNSKNSIKISQQYFVGKTIIRSKYNKGNNY